MKGTFVISAGAALALVALGGAPALAAGDDSTVSVLHMIPGITVDAYINGEEAITDFEPGELTDPIQLAPGVYDVQLYYDGETPDTAEPAVEALGVEVPAGQNLTITGNLTADDQPTLSVFSNSTEPVAAGQARLTVRHLAAAPAVDVRADGAVIAGNLTNPDEALVEVPAGAVSVDVVLAGTDDVVIGPVDVQLAEGANTIVTAWGNARQESLQLAVQVVDAHTPPTGVPSGRGGAGAQGALGVLLAVAGTLGLAAVAGRASRVRAARR